MNDRPAFNCPRCGKGCSSNGCPCAPPPAATSDKDEREHCERVGAEVYHPDSFEGADCHRTRCSVVIARERAAADKAGFERGRADAESDLQTLRDHVRQWVEARNALQTEIDILLRKNERIVDEWNIMNEASLALQSQLTATQGMLKDERKRFDRLANAARKYLAYLGSPHLPLNEGEKLLCDMEAALADKDESEVGERGGEPMQKRSAKRAFFTAPNATRSRPSSST